MRLALLIVPLLLVSACAKSSDLENIADTASGVLKNAADEFNQAKAAGKEVYAGAKATAEDLQNRAELVGEGIGKIREGKKLIEEGLGSGSGMSP